MSHIKTLIRAVLPVIRTDLFSSLWPAHPILCPSFFFLRCTLSSSLYLSNFIFPLVLLFEEPLSSEYTRSSPFPPCSLWSFPPPALSVAYLPLSFPFATSGRPYCSRPRPRVGSRFASARANREMLNERRDESDAAGGGETFARRRGYTTTASRDWVLHSLVVATSRSIRRLNRLYLSRERSISRYTSRRSARRNFFNFILYIGLVSMPRKWQLWSTSTRCRRNVLSRAERSISRDNGGKNRNKRCIGKRQT